ncbi:MAG: phosphate acyltransferase PlsX [Alphaproteobacteria bacterium]
MKPAITIALDAMGGDQAPDMVVGGLALARERFPAAHFMVIGNEARIVPLIHKYQLSDRTVTVRHAEQAIPSDMKPSQAVRQSKQSSMRLAIEAVQAGEAGAVVSAGNTGALMAISKIVLRTAPGIDRPAMASFFPSRHGENVMLDLGANIECDAENLVQFALMGKLFAQIVLGLSNPRVGLLNVGSEEMKGHDEVRGAAEILRNNDVGLEFHGFIEGDDIAAGTVDVIVTDGFSGNIALKTAEGTAKLYTHFLRESFKSSLFARLGYILASRALNKLRVRVDPRRYNGAVLLGLNGIVVKSHGSADALGFATAIGVAIDMAQHGFVQQVRDGLARIDAAIKTPPIAVAPTQA